MDAPREPRPFPYGRLKRIARARLPWLRRVARALGDAGPVATEIEGLLGTNADIEAAPLEHCPAGGLGAALTDPLLAVVLEHDSGTLGGRAALEVDPRLAAQVADRAFGGAGGDEVHAPVTPLSDAERGALAYVAARLVVASGTPFVVRGVVTSPFALAGALGDGGAAVLPARVRLGDAVGLARLWLPERLLDALSIAAPAPAGAAVLRVPVDLVLEAAWGTISRADLSALRVGDAVLFDESWLSSAREGLAGEVRARIAGARRMVLRCSADAGEIRVKTIDVGADPGATKGKRMDTDTKKTATDRGGDAPLEIAVEIARFTMPLSEVAALAPGEVLATGRAIGERVTLRANGESVATGELVDVDGEVGVRVLSLPS